MNLRPDILDHFDEELRRRKGPLASNYRREFDGNVSRAIGPVSDAAHNWIDHFNLNDDEIEVAIREQIAAYQSIGHSFRWKIYSHDRPDRLADCLLDAGFETWEPCSLMILDVGEFELQFPEGIEFKCVEDPDSLPGELRPIGEQVWDDPAGTFISALVAERSSMGAHLAITVAKRGHHTIGCGLIRYSERMTFGGLFAGATIPAERGKGTYRGVVSARVEHARQAGAEYLYTEAGPMSRPILERLGFDEVSTITNYVREVR